MGVNYTNITYDTSYPPAPAVHVNNSDVDIVVDGLDVDIQLKGPSSWTPTHYKLWNINGVTTSGAASWVTFSGSGSNNMEVLNQTLIEQSGKQYIYGQFYHTVSGTTGVVTSSGVTFSWTNPTIHSSVDWESTWSTLNYGSASSATLKNATYNTDIVLSKSNIPDLRYGGKDFSDIQVTENSILGSSSSYIGGLLATSAGAKLEITKVFDTDATPLIWVDKDDDDTRITLTQYDGSEKTSLSGDYIERVSNYSWNSGTKTLTFDINEFSQYGFTTIDTVEFTDDSTTGGYNGNSITIKVEVKDTVGEGVEGAPVTVTGVSGDVIGNFSSNPVNTGSDGIASFTLNLTSVGTAIYDAYVDDIHSVEDQLTWCIDFPGNIGRSLLRQYEQIRRSATYDDVISDVNTPAVAEPTVTGTTMRLEHDMNVLRTLYKQIKGTTNWYDDLGMYFDPTNTTSGSADTKQMSLANIKGKTTDSQTILLAVSDDNSGSGFTTASGDVGVLAQITTTYATATDRRGLPIFASSGNDYWDEGGSDEVCVVDLINTSTGGEFVDGSGNVIFGKLHDGLDHPTGSGTGFDVYVKFYTSAGAYTFTGSDPTNIAMVYPQRKVMNELSEWEWTRTDFVSSFEGDDELIEDISNLWSFTGAGNNITSPTWTNTGANYPLNSNPTDLEAAINELNNVIDDMTFTEDNYISDDDTVADALDTLDQSMKDVYDAGAAGMSEIYVEEISADIGPGTLHSLPAGVIYTPDSTSGREGSNMDVFLDGQLLAASTGANGVNEDRDYAETTTSGITFHMDVYQDSNVTYKVRE